MFGLTDKVVLVTGAARGTGRAHCEPFADEGADVIALDIAGAAMNYRKPQPKWRSAEGAVRRGWPMSLISGP
jgi:NAD(P)-dependent dehydrogenase (short-subunit alcohol dehydrogenase family)